MQVNITIPNVIADKKLTIDQTVYDPRIPATEESKKVFGVYQPTL